MLTKKMIKQFPAANATMWPLDKIIPYEKNPRVHPQLQIDLLATLIKTHGADQPIVVDDDGVILKGHGRRLAAMVAGLTEFPVVVHKGLSDTDKQAIRIADNRVALLSEWDENFLREELVDLRAQGFDMPMLGFDEDDLADIFGENDLVTERKLTVEEQTQLNLAWKMTVQDWARILDSYQAGGSFLSSQFTKGSLAVYFMRARLYGVDIPRAATLPYTGHRLFMNGDKSGSISDYLHLEFDPKPEQTPSIESIAWVCQGRPSIDKFYGQSLAFLAYRQPADFPAILARALINEFVTKPGGRVLDPCHGWGGRPLGFLLSDHATYYHGFEVDKKTVMGVRRMADDLQPFAAGQKDIELTLCPFEDAKLKPASYDFAFTSPPYFDVEKYEGEKQSWRRYATFDQWLTGFYGPMIVNVAKALKPDATFALQIGNQTYPLEDKARQIIETCGLVCIEKRTTEMINAYTGTNPLEGEIVLVLRKADAKAARKIKAAQPQTVDIKVSAKMARIAFTECGPACIKENGCKGNCCISASKPGGCFVTVHPDEQARVEAAGAVVHDGMIVPPAGTRGCPFHKAGLCSLFDKPARPFGCIASPFTLNRRGTLIIRNRYTVLPCHLGPGRKNPAYKTFRSSLVLLLGETETDRLTAHFDKGGGDCNASMPRAIYDKLMFNDEIKRSAKSRIKKGEGKSPPLESITSP